MKIIIFGANGAVGSECVRQAITDKNVQNMPRPLHDSHQACIWALGISQNAVNETEYIKITHDYTLAAAKSIANVNPTMRFIFISGMGADSTEQSRFLFGRIKGKTENDLVKESGLKEIYTVRPAGIIFTEQPSNKPWYERAFTPALRVFKVIKPAWVITAIGLSRTILYLAKNGHHATLFENQDLRNIISENHLLE
ncbi:unnamed protein product [Rotaria socialis]|uniref:NAD(P)-binding domain-containing protein n=1 Tax=Rotaria socialis TaxID=392032 RepID=A0A820P6P5_9BILA|nr:unnamed protein product [Rotaria socialis]